MIDLPNDVSLVFVGLIINGTTAAGIFVLSIPRIVESTVLQ